LDDALVAPSVPQSTLGHYLPAHQLTLQTPNHYLGTIWSLAPSYHLEHCLPLHTIILQAVHLHIPNLPPILAIGDSRALVLFNILIDTLKMLNNLLGCIRSLHFTTRQLHCCLHFLLPSHLNHRIHLNWVIDVDSGDRNLQGIGYYSFIVPFGSLASASSRCHHNLNLHIHFLRRLNSLEYTTVQMPCYWVWIDLFQI